jgi:hypothetical protein
MMRGVALGVACSGRVVPFALLCLAVSALPATAAADDTTPASPASGVRVSIRSLPNGESAELWTDGGDHGNTLVVQCTEDCEKTVPPGMYRVLRYDASGRQTGRTDAWVPSSTTFQASDRRLGGFGVGMGVLGAAATFFGVVWLASTALSFSLAPQSSEQQSSKATATTAATATFIAGAGLSAIGWTLFGINHPAFHTSRDEPQGPAVSFGVAPTAHGLTAGVGVAF